MIPIQPLQREIKVEQDRALAIIANHALNPEEGA
jgi:hypothetical protein